MPTPMRVTPRGGGTMHLFAGDSLSAKQNGGDAPQNGVDQRSRHVTKQHVTNHNLLHEQSAENREYLREFFHKEDCMYSHAMYLNAAKLFAVLRHESESETMAWPRRRRAASEESRDTSMPNIDFASELQKRRTFQLVYATLKYQAFLETMLEDCSFFHIHPEYMDERALVLVMSCDFKQRKFQRRTPLPGETLDTSLSEIEESLYSSRTKLNAALARSRIKARVLSLDHLLPSNVRQKESLGATMHLNCWVNQCKTDLNTVLDTLHDEGLTRVHSDSQLAGYSFTLDHQCSHLIAFPHDMRQYIEEHELVTHGHLVIQDKSSCVGPQSIRCLINEGDDILQVNIGSGLTTAHLASLTAHTESHIHAFASMTETQHTRMSDTLERLGAKSRVKLYNEDILQVDTQTDERLRHIKVVLLQAQCTRTAVANPVNFVVTEGEDMAMLKDLSLGGTNDRKLGQLVSRHNALLKHVLKMPRVQAVVYTTRSLLDAENEVVVNRAIEFANTIQTKRAPFRISPPVIPLSDRDIEGDSPLHGKFLKYPPSAFMSGCFVATITREADDPKEAAKDILARAAARGILNGVPVGEEKPAKSKSKSAKPRKGTKRAGRSPRRSRSNKDGGTQEKEKLMMAREVNRWERGLRV